MSNKKTTPNDLDILRHSASHVMASAVLEMFPEAKFAIGPSIENGFYYDFELPRTLIPEDLEILEEKMRAIIKANHPFERAEISFADALKDFKKANQPYKVELIKDLEKSQETNKPLNQLTIYKSGVFVDLCSGPHLESTGEIPADAFKLTKISGAYWRGDEKNKMLQRIYGVAFGSKNDLKEYLHMIEEAEKRNHVKLGKELRLFSTHIEGPGFPFFHPKGMIVWNELIKYWKEEHTKENYQEISTPIILNRTLWEKSGHWDHYKDNMYFTKIDETDYAVKPMNCPGGILVYKSDMHSYKELPLKLAEIGLVHRHELSGTLNGLFRVRMFRQDDAHIYCMENQIKDEIIKLTKMIERIYKTFGLSYHMELSTRPENSTGTDKIWEQAENALKDALNEMKVDYKLNPGDGAFYGPKIDFHIKDAIGRTWQCGTIQLDFSMPERFDLTYIGEDGKEHRPVMLHRVIYGAVERFMGILIEHYAGAFPLWLSPVQVAILPVSEKFEKYAKDVETQFIASGIRVELYNQSESLGKRIREAEKQKIPYMLVVGEKEEADNSVAVRSRGTKDQEVMKVENFVEKIIAEIKEKK
ncbi:MAG: Threonine-tRNA ligase [Candidatus Moranbacteria bacterium GW2011_GWF2_36_839]|nr:MAG: Threonine-tRNA ligase [Candidatus Moranbacteria bacterium GW2011_GWF1_36_78]KKQ17572.1 MAG: Threonine-tRNA ligase [Candidatus Moranbacteria bacterium GW2011_GWF2_36_839]HAT74297.1 threonine--tRNA ligase [Candidatus Moranbacteria bacterium]HBY10924.1 threonine--tRNA ligase [Candidatus Moranbacteria bacterium]